MSEGNADKTAFKQPAALILNKKLSAKPVYKGVAMIDIGISYPQLENRRYAQFSHDINVFYRNGARQYYEYGSHEMFNAAVKEFLYDAQQHYPFKNHQLLQTFETTYNQKSLVSIFYDRYEYTGGAHGNTTRASDTWYFSDGVHVELGDFFYGSYYKAFIYEYITNQIKQQIADGNTYYFDNYAKNVFRYFDEKNYYLTENGFALFYPLYTIAAYVQGISVFVIPYEAFGCELKTRLFE
jgi:hypothetical protein